MVSIISIENLRKFIEKEKFQCAEIHDKAADMIIFSVMTNDEKKTVNIIYNICADGTAVFEKAHIVDDSFEYFLNYLECMLLNAQCTYIKLYHGDRVVDFSRYDKVPTKKKKK